MSQEKRTMLFRAEQFDAQAKRTLGHAMYHGALPGEVFSILPSIRSGDFDSWYEHWYELAQAAAATADAARDPTSRGRALLRASNYYRAAMFFRSPTDESNAAIYDKSRSAFVDGLSELQIPHRILSVPYEHGQMRTYYFPGTPGRPLMLVHGGFDSTNEESYFLIGASLIERGYPLVMFEGPGQSSMARDYDIHFTPDWHRPVGTVLDFIEQELPDLSGSPKVLIGISLGGLLAARAAAVEPRIDGVVVFGAPFDTLDAGLSLNAILRLLYRSGRRNLLNRLVGLVMRFDSGARWALHNAMYTFGCTTPYDALHASAAYTLHDVHENVHCDVLALRGVDDIYGPAQGELFRTAFPNARSYEFVQFDRASGAAEHCQLGAVEIAAQEVVRWLRVQAIERPVPVATAAH